MKIGALLCGTFAYLTAQIFEWYIHKYCAHESSHFPLIRYTMGIPCLLYNLMVFLIQSTYLRSNVCEFLKLEVKDGKKKLIWKRINGTLKKISNANKIECDPYVLSTELKSGRKLNRFLFAWYIISLLSLLCWVSQSI